MPELQNSETKESDRISSILAGFLTPKELAQALGVSERTIDDGIISERVRLASKSGARSFIASNPSAPGSRPVNVQSHGPVTRDNRVSARWIRHTSRFRCNGTTSARFRDRAAATIEAKRLVA